MGYMANSMQRIFHQGKRNDQDEGMEIFTNFVKELDQSVKPSSAILMLMENLSSISSTIGMMQEFDEDLIHKFNSS